MTEAFRPCPVCGSHRIERLHTQRFVLEDGHPLKDGYDVAHCIQCGFVYADVLASQADCDAYYAELSKYDDPGTSTGSGESPLDRDRLAGTADKICSILPSLEARILDIGCAGGGLLDALQQRGYRNLVGVDPSVTCARLTRERTGEAYHGWVTSLPSQLGTFDCVVMSHVLEHVLDVSSAIRALRPRLREGALVYLEVPDAVRYADHIYAPFQDFNTEHINHFSRRSLDNTMECRGYATTDGGERLLHSSSCTYTPALYGVYRWTGNEASVIQDLNLKPAILRYIKCSSSLLSTIDMCIREALAYSQELVVWGTGQLTLKLLAEASLSHAKVSAFIDSNPIHQGRRLAGVPILAPAAIREYRHPILIATMLHHREILSQIEKLGLENRIILLPEAGPAYLTEGQNDQTFTVRN